MDFAVVANGGLKHSQKLFSIVAISKTVGRGGLKRFLNNCVNFLFVMSTKGELCGGLNILIHIYFQRYIFIYKYISRDIARQGNIWLTQSMKD